MSEIDRRAVQYGLPIEMMMENAGKSMALHVFQKIKNHYNKKIVCIAGKGNNGGGIISASRHLTCLGYDVTLISLYDKKLISKPSNFHLFLTRKNPKIKTIFLKKSNMKQILSAINKAHIIIDDIFGTGFNSKVIEPIFSIISHINKSRAYVISNDIPSGINADTGEIGNIAVKPNLVLVLHKPKMWMKNTKIPFKLVDIGIPPTDLPIMKYGHWL